MNKMKKIYIICCCVSISILSAIIWWKGWTYNGFWGGPDIFSKFWRLDGEAAYNIKLLEFLLYSFLLTFAITNLRRWMLGQIGMGMIQKEVREHHENKK